MDPYRVLGVGRDATQEDISRAYRAMAGRYHPDRNPDDHEVAASMFKEATAAFELIGTAEKRRSYDLSSRPASFSFRSRNSVDDVFDNLFSQFFGPKGGAEQGFSRSRVRVSLAEAYSGCTRKVGFESREACGLCHGTGSTEWSRCSPCGGTGFVVSADGHVRIQTSCSSCSGRGSKPVQSCSPCNGRGYRVSAERSAEVRIPAGVEDGTQIRVAGSDGDLFVVVSVDKDPNVSRHKTDLFVSLDVPYSTLVLGGEASVALFGSSISLRVPRGTRAGSRIRVRGMGMPHMRNESARGDLFVEVGLFVPVSLTKDHERLVARLAKIEAASYSKSKENT
jgi:molecular chaperone DnaJ